MSRVVQAGQLKSVSASQINTYWDCKRKWYFDKVMGMPQPETEALGRGTRIHEQMEKWYELGQMPTYPSAIAALELPEVPPRSDSLVIEEPRNYGLGLMAAGVPVRGRIDMRIPPKDGVFRILDWKSTSNPKYAKTPEELSRNPQGIIYLKYGFNVYPEAHAGIFQHVYLRTAKGFGAISVETDELDREHVDRVYAHIESVVADMKATAALPSVADVEPNLASCDKYGGCPYRDTCPRVARSIFDGLDDSQTSSSLLPQEETEDMTDIKSKLAARKASTASGINPPDAAKPPAVAPYTPPAPSLDQWSLEKVEEAQVSPSGSGLGQPASPETNKDQAVCIYLYIDCQPTYGVGVDVRLEDEIAARTPGTLAGLGETSAVDVREVKFGAGTAALVAGFKRNPPRGVVVASSQGLSGLVVEALAPMASLVVKAVR